MSKLYTSHNVNKWGIVEKGENVEYETSPNRSCLVIVVGLVLIALIAVFIFKNWDSTSLLLGAGLYYRKDYDAAAHDDSTFRVILVLLVPVITVLFGISLFVS